MEYDDRRIGLEDLVKLREEGGEAGGQETGAQEEGVAHSHPTLVKGRV